MDVKRFFQTIKYFTFFNSNSRAEYVRKKHIFGAVGNDVRLPLMVIPFRAENIILHNNIEIASGVKMIPHDAIHSVFNKMNGGINNFKEHKGKIEIFDNVFIGANSILLGPVAIGPNAIVAAGAVVNKDVPPNSVVGGVPAKVIGSFDELKKKRGGEARVRDKVVWNGRKYNWNLKLA